MAEQRRTSRRDDGPPTSYAEGPPSASHDHSFTLQAVMEMQKTLGSLVEKIDRLRADTDHLRQKFEDTCDKVDKINLKLAWVAGICAALVAVAVVTWTVATQIPWEALMSRNARG